MMLRQNTVLLWLWLLAYPIYCDDSVGQTICDAPGLRNLGFSSATCPSQRSFSKDKDLHLEIHNGWVQGDACQDIGSAKFCSYTRTSFNDGFGVSLITTSKRLDEISSLPAFTTKKPWRNSKLSYHEEEVPGKGIGLVATRQIPAGELILARTPAVLVDDEGFTDLGESSLTRLLVQAIEGLPEQHQSEYLKLTTHENVKRHDERVYQIFAKNNYRTRIANTTDFHATFVDGKFYRLPISCKATTEKSFLHRHNLLALTICVVVSRLNHDCRPNCGYQFDSTTLTQRVYAARDILPGEELTVAYTE